MPFHNALIALAALSGAHAFTLGPNLSRANLKIPTIPRNIGTIAPNGPRPFCVSSAFDDVKRRPVPLFSTEASDTPNSTPDEEKIQTDELVLETATSLRRTSWLSWWGQVILSTVSGVTLLFAKSVMNSGTAIQGVERVGGGFFFGGAGVALSTVSIFWTWGGARLARRLVRKNTSRIAAANMMRRAVAIAANINLLGMLITLLGAEVIVGTLAAKVLTMQGVSASAAAVATQTLQPLDILVVQANTNTLLSHFVGLTFSLYLTRYIDRLDPPSKEDAARK